MHGILEADQSFRGSAFFSNWCKVGKTQVGRLLSPKEFSDDKSYRNHVDKLMLRAARLSIRQE